MRKNRKKKIIILGVLIIILIIGIICWIYSTHMIEPNVITGIDNKPSSFVKEMKDDEFVEYLQKKADKGEFHLKMNTDMIFESATQSGEIDILNPTSNQYAIRVETTIAGEPETVIYDSGIIMPKQYVESGELIVKVKEGVYKTINKVSYYELDDTRKKVGETAVVGQLSVNN